ncbi:MAG: hypothetical protein K8S54_08650 [Spirochaetia bacterium]|nr:hypothetical protein [Spirochaetia bacterium]
MNDFISALDGPGFEDEGLPDGFLAMSESLPDDEFFEIDDETFAEILSDSRRGSHNVEMM